jgi:protein-tyrosine phosphatase
MIDLHCHMLPGIDDGAPDLETALEMARIAAADGTTTLACTPHIYPVLYENDGPAIKQAVTVLRRQIDDAGIVLQITHGADTHLAPDLVAGLRSQHIPTLHDSGYFLLEPPHHVAPPRLEQSVFDLLTAGFIPVVTHPERLTWIADHYEIFIQMARAGAWMQITADSLAGHFGSAARYWGERMLDEGLVHILASDGHGIRNRPPVMSRGREVAARFTSAEEATLMVITRPQGILDNVDPTTLPKPPGIMNSSKTCRSQKSPKQSIIRWLLGAR